MATAAPPAKTFAVGKKALLAILTQLGYKVVEKFTDARILEKVNGLGDLEQEDLAKVKDPTAKASLKTILATLEKGGKVSIATANAAPVTTKPKVKVEETEEEEVEGEEEVLEGEEEEEPAPKVKPGTKPAGKTPPKAAAEPAKTGTKPAAKPAPKAKGPGVIATIIGCLKTATAKKPVTKEQIVTKLVDTFPERVEKSMKSTVAAQVPSGLKNEKQIKCETDGKGGWWVTDSKGH